MNFFGQSSYGHIINTNIKTTSKFAKGWKKAAYLSHSLWCSRNPSYFGVTITSKCRYLWSTQWVASTSANCFIFLPLSARAKATFTTSWWFCCQLYNEILIHNAVQCIIRNQVNKESFGTVNQLPVKLK